MSRRSNRPPKGSDAAGRRGRAAWTSRLALFVLWLLILAPPLVLSPAAKDNFRMPKLLVSESLALLSLVFLVFRLRGVGRLEFRTLARRPVLVAALPLLAVATATLVTTEHPHHVHGGLVSLWIGVAALVGWSLALGEGERRRLLHGLAIPATLLSVLAIFQFHGFNPFSFVGRTGARMQLTSLAGGAFDLGGYLVLPLLLAQVRLLRAESWRDRLVWSLPLVTGFYATLAARTLSAFAALALASLVLWFCLLPRRRFLAVAAILAVVVGGSAAGFGPLRQRVLKKGEELMAGRLNSVFSGRFDGWSAAWWMLGRHPVLGVGHGAYVAEFGHAKLDLVQNLGVRFYSGKTAFFANAHNDFLELGAECGGLGIAALVWGLAVLARQLRRRFRSFGSAGPERDHAIELTAGVAALGVLAFTWFPLHLGLLAYPYLLLLSGALGRSEAAPDGAEAPS